MVGEMSLNKQIIQIVRIHTCNASDSTGGAKGQTYQLQPITQTRAQTSPVGSAHCVIF